MFHRRRAWRVHNFFFAFADVFLLEFHWSTSHCKYGWTSIINWWLNWRRNADSVKDSSVVSPKCENFNLAFSVGAICGDASSVPNENETEMPLAHTQSTMISISFSVFFPEFIYWSFLSRSSQTNGGWDTETENALWRKPRRRHKIIHHS